MTLSSEPPGLSSASFLSPDKCCCYCCPRAGSFGDNYKSLWVGYEFQWHRNKKLPTKKQPQTKTNIKNTEPNQKTQKQNQKTMPRLDRAINNLPVYLGRELHVLTAVVSHSWEETAPGWGQECPCLEAEKGTGDGPAVSLSHWLHRDTLEGFGDSPEPLLCPVLIKGINTVLQH